MSTLEIKQELGIILHSAFFLLFLSLTGCNSSVDEKKPAPVICQERSGEDRQKVCYPGKMPPVIPQEQNKDCVKFSYQDYSTNRNEPMALINRVLESLPNCKNSTSHPDCKEISPSLKFARPWCQSINQRTLVIEGAEILNRALYYPNRILASYVWESQKGFTSTGTLGKISKIGYEFLNSDVFGNSYYFLSSLYITRQIYGEAQNSNLFGKLAIGSDSAHGANILGFLADYNPYMQFVLLKRPPIDPSFFCSENMDLASEHYDGLLAHVQNLIQYHGISYINYSGGRDQEVFRTQFQSACGKNPNEHFVKAIDKLETNFLRQLSDNTFLVQSGHYGTNEELDADNPEFLSDCAELPGRLRVGYLGALSTKVGTTGGSIEEYLSELDTGQKNVRRCIDLFINTGWHDGFQDNELLYPIVFGSGFVSAPLGVMTTSFAAPAALSYANYIQQEHFHLNHSILSAGELKSKILENRTSLADPAKLKQFEICKYDPSLCESWLDIKYPYFGNELIFLKGK